MMNPTTNNLLELRNNTSLATLAPFLTCAALLLRTQPQQNIDGRKIKIKRKMDMTHGGGIGSLRFVDLLHLSSRLC